jgi:hypothetical protein
MPFKELSITPDIMRKSLNDAFLAVPESPAADPRPNKEKTADVMSCEFF